MRRTGIAHNRADFGPAIRFSHATPGAVARGTGQAPMCRNQHLARA
jgi:hypothetical protein